MELRGVGRSGLTVSAVGLGTMTWGRDTDEHEAAEQLKEFVSAGGTLLDTAAGYTDGASERLVGSLLGRTVDRDDVVIATKAGVSRRAGKRVVNTSRATLIRNLDASLRRLGVDHVDLWQVHTWSDTAPMAETLSALDFAVSTGRAAYAGISNYSGWQTAAAATHQTCVPGRAPLVSTQVEYSLLNRRVEDEVLGATEALGLGVLAWSPLGRGVLTGKYRTGTPADSRGASSVFADFVGAYGDERSRGIVEAVARAADGLGWAPLEVALAWLLDRPGISSAIVGPRTHAQLQGILGAVDKDLPASIRDALDDVSAAG